MSQWVKGLPYKPGDLSTISGTQVKVEEESIPHNIVLTSTCACDICRFTHTHTPTLTHELSPIHISPTQIKF